MSNVEVVEDVESTVVAGPMRYLTSVFKRHTAGEPLNDLGAKPDMSDKNKMPLFLQWCRGVVRLAGSFHDTYVDKLPEGIYGACSDDTIWVSTTLVKDFSETEVLDVSAAIALHEAAHSVYTKTKCRSGMMQSEPLKARLYNFFEDERIEALLTDDAPAFAGHLELSCNLVNKSFEKSTDEILERLASGKEEIREGDYTDEECEYVARGGKLRSVSDIAKEILCANYARCPRQFARMRNALTGELRELADKMAALDIPEPYDNDFDSRAATVTVLRLLESGVAEYDKENAQYFEKPETPEERAERAEREEELQKQYEEEVEQIAKMLRKFFKLVQGMAKTMAEKLGEKATAGQGIHVQGEQAPPEQLSPQAEQLVQALAQMQQGDGEETDACPLSNLDFTVIGEADTHGIEIRERFPKNTLSSLAHYDESDKNVKRVAEAMAAIFNVRAKDKTIVRPEQKFGRIHSRRLALAPATNKVFRTSSTKKVPGIDVTILVDCSGSMDGGGTRRVPGVMGSGNKIELARDAAVLLATAARRIRGVNLRVYGHTTGRKGNTYSYNPKDNTCEIYCFYDPRRKMNDLRKLGAIQASDGNLDNLAVLKVTERILQDANEQEDKWLIVISDGMPNSIGFTGKSAVEATRHAVNDARRKHIQVLAVDIEGSQCEKIYGKEHVCKFTDPAKFVIQMRTLVLRMIKKNTER